MVYTLSIEEVSERSSERLAYSDGWIIGALLDSSDHPIGKQPSSSATFAEQLGIARRTPTFCGVHSSQLAVMPEHVAPRANSLGISAVPAVRQASP